MNRDRQSAVYLSAAGCKAITSTEGPTNVVRVMTTNHDAEAISNVVSAIKARL
jgi:hypothetical protein